MRLSCRCLTVSSHTGRRNRFCASGFQKISAVGENCSRITGECREFSDRRANRELKEAQRRKKGQQHANSAAVTSADHTGAFIVCLFSAMEFQQMIEMLDEQNDYFTEVYPRYKAVLEVRT